MKIKYILGMVILMGLTNCTPEGEPTTFFSGDYDMSIESTAGFVDVQNANISTTGYKGSVAITDSSNADILFNFDETAQESKQVHLRNNLNGKPYHLSFSITYIPKDDHPDPTVGKVTITYFADFERPLRYNENYRMPVTLVLHQNNTFIENNAAGIVGFEFRDPLDPTDTSKITMKDYGMEINSELEIQVGPETADGSIQQIKLVGNFVFPSRSGSTNIFVGNIEASIKGENLVDLSFF